MSGDEMSVHHCYTDLKEKIIHIRDGTSTLNRNRESKISEVFLVLK